jgi:hypothetical protein
MEVINVCQEVNCPYFSENTKKSWGCQKFMTAFCCPLIDELEDKISNQCVLYTAHYDPKLVETLNNFLSKDQEHLERLKLKETINLEYPKD